MILTSKEREFAITMAVVCQSVNEFNDMENLLDHQFLGKVSSFGVLIYK